MRRKPSPRGQRRGLPVSAWPIDSDRSPGGSVGAVPAPTLPAVSSLRARRAVHWPPPRGRPAAVNRHVPTVRAWRQRGRLDRAPTGGAGRIPPHPCIGVYAIALPRCRRGTCGSVPRCPSLGLRGGLPPYRSPGDRLPAAALHPRMPLAGAGRAALHTLRSAARRRLPSDDFAMETLVSLDAHASWAATRLPSRPRRAHGYPSRPGEPGLTPTAPIAARSRGPRTGCCTTRSASSCAPPAPLRLGERTAAADHCGWRPAGCSTPCSVFRWPLAFLVRVGCRSAEAPWCSPQRPHFVDVAARAPGTAATRTAGAAQWRSARLRPRRPTSTAGHHPVPRSAPGDQPRPLPCPDRAPPRSRLRADGGRVAACGARPGHRQVWPEPGAPSTFALRGPTPERVKDPTEVLWDREALTAVCAG